MCGRTCFVPLLCLLLLGSFANARTYYISPSGSDTATGSASAPFATFTRSVSSLSAGDVLIVRSGTYTEALDLSPLGVNAAPITIRAEVPRQAIIDGGDGLFTVGSESRISRINLVGLVATGSECAFRFKDASNITLRNCEARNSWRGLNASNGSNFLMEDCDIHNNRFGVMFGFEGTTGVAGITIRRCRAIDNTDSEHLANTDGFVVEGNCSRLVITDCLASGSADSGFDIKPQSSRLERCQAIDNYVSGFKFWQPNSLLANSIAIGNGIHGVAIGANGIRLWNCTFARNDEGYSMQLEAPDNSTVVVRNCIFFGNAVNLMNPKMYDDNCNLYWIAGKQVMLYRGQTGVRITRLASGRKPFGPRSIVANPQFISAPDRDYNLSSTSPAIGAGVWNALYALDVLGRQRVQPMDLGAFAYNTASIPVSPLALQATAVPSPSGMVQLQVHASTAATAEVVIRNLAGRAVGTMGNQRLQRGPNTLMWSGRSRQGTVAPAGAYLAEITAHSAAGEAVRCLVRLQK